MFRIENGRPVQVPDDERITPLLDALRGSLNDLLRQLTCGCPDCRAKRAEIDRLYREGVLSREFNIDWFADPCTDVGRSSDS